MIDLGDWIVSCCVWFSDRFGWLIECYLIGDWIGCLIELYYNALFDDVIWFGDWIGYWFGWLIVFDLVVL